ncbi:MAG: ribonuclease G [Porticoccaceae bacterium]|nr:ribonuclease G [Pseudomonadales bacterium]MCP5173375.1 ribonuclease G [Pseudomonadales bacterium]MCP5303187.1 ribonuclease G [Pseudomonadales bacterium]
MNSEILINMTPMETRVAHIENGVLQEVSLERTYHRGFVGNIYRGKVVRVLPGMQAAFVDIGLERAGFIHIDDIHLSDQQRQELARAGELDVRRLLREGQLVNVQVAKDPIGSKGARLTTQLSLSSRYLVFMPQVSKVGISQRIGEDAERERLRSLLEEDVTDGEGYIVRTAAEGISDEEIHADKKFLKQLWRHLEEKFKVADAPAKLYEDLPLHLRTLRDVQMESVEKIRVDSGEFFHEMKVFAEQFNPEMSSKIERYTDDRPLFYLYGVEDEISRALDKRVHLKSGGDLVIEQTESMTTIDVNTGTFVGHRNLEETIFKTNLEAATAISRQLRLRNLGGIIIIDFIDMRDVEHQRQVHRILEKSLERDRAKTVITGVSDLGLVEMTRKRTSESLVQMLCEPCPACDGKGSMKSAETVCHEILREILREARAFECDRFLVLAAPVVIDRLLDENSANVADLEEFLGRRIELRVEDVYSREQYDIIPVHAH